MKRQYIFLMSAIATMMTLTSCDTLLAIDSTPAGTVYTSGGTIYTSGGTIYNTAQATMVAILIRVCDTKKHAEKHCSCQIKWLTNWDLPMHNTRLSTK